MSHVSRSHGHYDLSIIAGIHIGESQLSALVNQKLSVTRISRGRDGQSKSAPTSRDGQGIMEIGLDSRVGMDSQSRQIK